jgi:hypothetical protein
VSRRRTEDKKSALPRYPRKSQPLYSRLSFAGVKREDDFTARADRAWQGKPDARDWTSSGPRRRDRRKSGKPDAPRSHRRRQVQQWSFRTEMGRPRVARPAGRVTGKRCQQWKLLPVTPQAVAVGLSPCSGEADEQDAKDLTGRRRLGKPKRRLSVVWSSPKQKAAGKAGGEVARIVWVRPQASWISTALGPLP